MTHYKEALEDAIQRARREQRTVDVCRHRIGQASHYWGKLSTEPLARNAQHVATVHCDGRVEKVTWSGTIAGSPPIR